MVYVTSVTYKNNVQLIESDMDASMASSEISKLVYDNLVEVYKHCIEQKWILNLCSFDSFRTTYGRSTINTDYISTSEENQQSFVNFIENNDFLMKVNFPTWRKAGWEVTITCSQAEELRLDTIQLIDTIDGKDVLYPDLVNSGSFWK